MMLRQAVSTTQRHPLGAGPKDEGRDADTRSLADIAIQVNDTRPISTRGSVCAQRMVNA
jgi:hypothetical protein